MNIISYSLYGNNKLYTLGAIENARINKIIFPNWISRFYIHHSVDKSVIDTLKSYGADVVEILKDYKDEKEMIAKCTFWRYYAINDSDAKYVIFRDCDSRTSYKELEAINQWISSNKNFHLLYDHPQHTIEILGGLWGAKVNSIDNIKQIINNFFNNHDHELKYNRLYDQIFLKSILWPKYVSKSYMAHGNIDECDYHIKRNIHINPYPISHGFIHTGLTQQTRIGQTILTPYAEEKPKLNHEYRKK